MWEEVSTGEYNDCWEAIDFTGLKEYTGSNKKTAHSDNYCENCPASNSEEPNHKV